MYLKITWHLKFSDQRQTVQGRYLKEQQKMMKLNMDN